MNSLKNSLIAIATVTALAIAVSAQAPAANVRQQNQHMQNVIRPGTILPVRLESTISSAKSKPEQTITARIMQDVPLASGSKIRAGTKVVGRIMELTSASSKGEAKVILRFDTLKLSTGTIPVRTNLRAIASPLDIDDAQTPKSGPDEATPPTSWTTVQVGDEVAYRGVGIYAGETHVGHWVYEGALARPRANPNGRCPGSINGNDLALWVFSSDACGVYDIPKVKIDHAGRTDPVGEIVLTSNRGDLRIPTATGILLRITPSEMSE